MLTRSNRSQILLACVLVFALAWIPYLHSGRFDFVNYDDSTYVYQNDHVRSGLNGGSILWALGPTAATTANWHPLTFLSLMADVSLFGARPGPMHLHNALIHACNAVLLFLLLLHILRFLRPAGQAHAGGLEDAEVMGAAALGALFWAVHPLRTESVAWISSRKDVLCVFWFLLGTIIHWRGLVSEPPDARRRPHSDFRTCLVAVCFLLAFMSKPTAMVFPATAMVLELAATARISWRRNELLVFLMVACALVAVYAQDAGGAISKGHNLGVQLLNAVAAIGRYVVTTVAPSGLSFFYPYESPVPLHRLVPGILFLCVVADFLLRRVWPLWKAGGAIFHRPALYAAGWLWFLVALAPVLGFVQAGMASCADRYTYLSGIGISIVVALAADGLAQRVAGRWRRLLAAAAVLWLAALCALAVRQAGVWKGTVTLLNHAVAVRSDNHVAHCNLAAYYFEKKEFWLAYEHIRQSAMTGMTDFYMPRVEAAMTRLGGFTNTADALQMTVRDDDPHAAIEYHGLGMIAVYRKLDAAAEVFLKKSVALGGAGHHPWELLGYLYERQGRHEEALAAFEKASAMEPKRKALKERIREARRKIASGERSPG
jgi:tetratricopeptide (TPR) repeat protein